MPGPFKPIDLKPDAGGRLLSDLSHGSIGALNYRVKRDWRRVQDREVRAEGYDYFRPNTSIALGNQASPNEATKRTVTSVTRSGSTATVTISGGHRFQEGESITIAGASQTAYNGTFTITARTPTTFTYAVIGSPATPATGTITAKSAMPITLKGTARRPNGKTAVIAGTATTLFRYFGLESGQYVSDCEPFYYFAQTGNGTPYVATSGTGTPYTIETPTTSPYFSEDPADYPVGEEAAYVNDNPGEWIVIADGFSPAGNRWEVKNLNGYMVFNNGVDLLHTYRVEDFSAFPVYELREQGVASVGTIAVINGVLLVMDVREIKEDALEELLNPVDSGSITASQAGSVYSGTVTAKVTNGVSDTVAGNTVTASGSIFSAGMVGKEILLFNGLRRTITAYTSATVVTIDGDARLVAAGTPFYVISADDTDFTVESTAAIFEEKHVGQKIYFDSGEVRTIREFISSTSVVVESHKAIAATGFSIENPDTYAAFTDESQVNRIQWRVGWAMLNEPRRWAATVPGSIAAGSTVLSFDRPTQIFERGQSILILGASESGGNLTATIEYFADGGRTAVISTPALTTVAGSEVIASDAVGSIAGYEDLQEDGSGIMAALDLRGTLVIYRVDSGIINLARYTGVIASPFDFVAVNAAGEQVSPGATALYYKNTLINVGGAFHLYAGKNCFYKFDLTNQVPEEFKQLDDCKNLFYDQVSLEDTNLIFAADNAVTKEIFFCFPSSTSDKALRFDYKKGTVSTTSGAYTAAATVKRPVVGINNGPGEDWFCMGTTDGKVLRYGLTDSKPVDSDEVTAVQAGTTVTAEEAIFTTEHVGRTIIFESGKKANITEYVSATVVTVGVSQTVAPSKFWILPAIWHRLGSTYACVLESGLDAFGNTDSEKSWDRYVPQLAAPRQAPEVSPDCTLQIDFLGAVNAAKKPTVLGSWTMTDPQDNNLVTLHFQQFFLGDRITVSDLNAPCELVSRLYSVAGVRSESHGRRP